MTILKNNMFLSAIENNNYLINTEINILKIQMCLLKNDHYVKTKLGLR